MDVQQSKSVLELNLLDSGVDFILKGIDEIFERNYVLKGYAQEEGVILSDYKYGVSHLLSGFLLLLKERLARHSIELIFIDRSPEIQQKLFARKNLKTIDFEEAIERLGISPQVVFSQDEIAVFRTIQEMRSQFEHYLVSIDRYLFWKNIAKFLEVVDRFLLHELNVGMDSSAKSLELHIKLYALDTVWRRFDRERRQKWYQKLQVQLQKFQQSRYQIIGKLKSEYRSNGNAGAMFTECPHCHQPSLIVYGEFEGICSNSSCGHLSPLKKCNRCGESMPGFSLDFGLCESCLEAIEVRSSDSLTPH
jgi:hypothetical protein